MSMNWLEGTGMNHDMMEQPGQPMAMPVFAGQKLVVVGGSSGMGRQTAADVVAAGGSAVIIGDGKDKVDDTVKALTTRAPTTIRTSNWTGPSSSSPRRWPGAWSRKGAAGPS